MSYGIQKAEAKIRGSGDCKVYAASGINPMSIGSWSGRHITPNGEKRLPVSHEVEADRNWSYPIGGGRLRPTPRTYTVPISVMQQSGRSPSPVSPQDLPSWALGTVDALTSDEKEPIIDEPEGNVNVEIARGMDDQALTNALNESIAEGWRLKGCSGPYCMVQATRNFQRRSALAFEYRSRQADREMPPLQEPVHTLAYGRYKLAKAVVSWADKHMHGKVLWPMRVYVKAAAYAMEDFFGGRYLTMLILSSPLLGAWLARKVVGKGLSWEIFGGYAGMAMGALLPVALFSLAQFLGERKEKDFLWIVT